MFTCADCFNISKLTFYFAGPFCVWRASQTPNETTWNVAVPIVEAVHPRVVFERCLESAQNFVSYAGDGVVQIKDLTSIEEIHGYPSTCKD